MDELYRRILEAREMLLEAEIEANTVVLNQNKYAKFINQYGNPTIFGMAVELQPLQKDIDFFVQYRALVKSTNADRIRSMSDEELAKMIIKYATGHNVDICPETRSNMDCYEQETCTDCWLEWLKQEVTD